MVRAHGSMEWFSGEADCCFDVVVCAQVVINVVQGFRPDVPEETHLPPGSSTSTCEYPSGHIPLLYRLGLHLSSGNTRM